MLQEDNLSESNLAASIPEKNVNNLYIYETDSSVSNKSIPLSSITPESAQEISPAYSIPEEKEPLQQIFEFGIPGEHLLFSEPIALSYAVPFPEGSLVEVQVQHAGDATP